MFSISDGGTLARVLKSPIDLRLKKLLIERRDQLGGDLQDVRFFIVQAGDSMKALEQELGWSVFENVTDGRRFGDPEFSPSFEWLAFHDGRFEMVFNLGESTHVILVPDSPMQNRDLRLLCLTFANQVGVAQ